MNELLIVGASARAAAQSAIRGGFSVVAADLFADQDLRQIAECHQVEDYPDDILKVLRDHRRLSRSAPVMYTGAIENYPAFIDKLSQAGPLYGNSADVVRLVRDPLNLQFAFRRHNVPFPLTARGMAEVHAAMVANKNQRWLRKSLRSAGGQHVEHYAAPDSKEDSPEFFFQQFIEGQVCSAAFVANASRCELIGVSDMVIGCPWLGASNFAYCGSLNRNAETAELFRWRTIGDKLRGEFGLGGTFGVDAVVHNQTVIPIEINPRYTASMELFEIERSFSIVGEHVKAFTGKPLTHTEPPRREAGKLIVYAASDTRFPNQISSPPEIQLADVPVAGSSIQAGHPVLTMISTGKSRENLLANLKNGAKSIYQQLDGTAGTTL